MNIANIDLGGVYKVVHDSLAGLHLVDKPSNVFVVFTLSSRQPWIFAHAFKTVLSIDLIGDASNTGNFAFICMTAGKSKNVPRIKSRIANGRTLKRNIINNRNCI